MINGLYFKLHDDIKLEKEIIDFFNQESKKLGVTKIELLKRCYNLYQLADAYKEKEVNIVDKN